MHPQIPWAGLLGVLILATTLSSSVEGAEPTGTPGMIGLARIDITPSYPVRLTGYAARTNMTAEVAQRLWAKALAVGSDAEGPRVLVTVDNCGVPASVSDEVARRLAVDPGLTRDRLAVASSHTHSAPMVRGFAENIFIRDLTADEEAAANQYTRELTDRLESVAREALKKRQPGRLFTARGEVGFAANRRPQGGPVAHGLPILIARDAGGKVIGVVANYACHCTTLGAQVNRCHGDWAGFAQEAIEADHPGALALITIGCGADANPSPRGGEDFGLTLARRHGAELAAEVKRLVAGDGVPLPGLPQTALRRFPLPFQTLPSRGEWEQRAQSEGIVGYHARKNLHRLDHGETLPTTLPYVAQTWVFGDRLAMVFLAGEVVVDYALRLQDEFDPSRLWITAYANDVPCYIPSRRILDEGGYEAETSLWYYDRPARLAPVTEDLIHGEVAALVPRGFRRATGQGLPR